jgi:hypothetical protein
VILLLAACLESLLEAPFILSAGMGPVQDLSPTPDRDLFAATEDGIFLVTAEGTAVLKDPLQARAITAHMSRIYVLHEDVLQWTTLPLGAAEWKRLPAPGQTNDIQAWCDEVVLLATSDGLMRWIPDTGSITPMPWGGPAEHLSLMTGAPCGEVVTSDQGTVTHHRGADATVIARDLGVIHALTVAADGSVWVVHRGAPVLSVLSGGLPEVRARHLGDVRAVQFGSGGIWAPENAYLASGEGRIDYARVR